VQADATDPLPPVEEEEEDLEDNMNKIVYPQRMGYEELNMIGELYMEILQTQRALEVLHNGICNLQGVDPKTISYNSRTDYDELLFNVPVELRVKIGLCCLHSDNAQAADVIVLLNAELIFCL
jgi:general transcription factor 3C polypeptide 3 (transcription factor C subunit 4)